MREDAQKIIAAEKLTSCCFFLERNDYSDELVIRKTENGWTVYATDGRASKIADGEKFFDSEEQALDNFIRRLRALNKYLSSR